jgi:hypothetical protein
MKLDIKYLKALSESKELQAVEWYKCKNDPYYWLTTWAKTLDTHDPEDPKKTFPEKEYIKILVEQWLNSTVLCVPKTRQMMVSWIFVALNLWDVQFHRARLSFFQSKKADDANDLVKRAKTIWDNEPQFMKNYYDKTGEVIPLTVNPQNNGSSVYNLMSFPQIDSEIRGIPEGGDQIRAQTASSVLADEFAFQPEAKSSFMAAKPTISCKGRFTMVSTPEDNTFFQDCVFDLLEM